MALRHLADEGLDLGPLGEGLGKSGRRDGQQESERQPHAASNCRTRRLRRAVPGLVVPAP